MTNCTKEKSESCQDITGGWEWIYTLTVFPSPKQTPENTGINEIVVYNPDKSWFRLQNGVKVDSGIYAFGHGTYCEYEGSYVWIYDSIAYYVNGKKLRIGDYYKITNDTLRISGGIGGRFSCYSMPLNGTKVWKKIFQ
jgi:hypothetical protein